MKLMAITTLQVDEKQNKLYFSKEIKKMQKLMGWENEGVRLAIYRHGAGFFIASLSSREAQELEKATDKVMLKGDKDA